MAITGSGMYGLTIEKAFQDTLGLSVESTAWSGLMVTDTHAPAFDTDDFRSDLDNEVSGGGYTAGGKSLDATPTLTVASPGAGQIAYDFANVIWTGSTITSAMAGVTYHSTGTAANDELLCLSDFITAASTSNGTFTWTVHASGQWYIDYIP